VEIPPRPYSISAVLDLGLAAFGDALLDRATRRAQVFRLGLLIRVPSRPQALPRREAEAARDGVLALVDHAPDLSDSHARDREEERDPDDVTRDGEAASLHEVHRGPQNTPKNLGLGKS
jgi:hypothetical protein